MQDLIKKKICLLGSYGVGKTSLVQRFVYNKFEEKYLSTIGVHISKKKINLSNKNSNIKNSIELFIWDISNIEKFDAIGKIYFNGAHGAIIVTDITRPITIEKTIEFTNTFLQINPNAVIKFVGNKIDLAENDFDKEKYLTNFNSFDNSFSFTSAKTGENVENVFKQLAEKLLKDN